jgi:hypothetical protein
MSSHTPPTAVAANAAPQSTTKLATQLIIGGILYAIFLGLIVRPSDPWESDQPFKAAQILEIAHGHDYLLSPAVRDCYRLGTLSFYYSASALLYNLIGGDLFTVMNYSSVPLGVLAGVSFAWALYNAFKISPVWSFLVLFSMPLFVVTSTYGNEAAWSIAFFCLSMALVSTSRVSLQLGGGAAVAISLFCRTDVVLLAPYWLAWVLLFCHTEKTESWIVRVLRPSAAFILMGIVLWLLLLRRIPKFNTTSEYVFNIKLVAAYLSYPFNLSIVLLGAIGWLMLIKRRATYAWAHLLLLIPLVFYLHLLSSPKYIICLLIFYGLPAAYLLEQSKLTLRVAMVALIGVWFFIGLSVFGVFGPQKAALWYVPSADGPTPIGGYLAFYQWARAGDYQLKQVENIKELYDFVDFAKTTNERYWVVGYQPVSAFRLARARGDLGTPEQAARIQSICDPPDEFIQEQPADAPKIIMFRIGYTDLKAVRADVATRIRSYLEKGQLRPVGPGAHEVLPTLIELGDHINEGENSILGKRILFAIDYFHGRRIYEQPTFVPAYRATSWVPATTKVEGAPLYRDAEVAVYDRPIEGAKIFSFVWPARYQ